MFLMECIGLAADREPNITWTNDDIVQHLIHTSPEFEMSVKSLKIIYVLQLSVTSKHAIEELYSIDTWCIELSWLYIYDTEHNMNGKELRFCWDFEPTKGTPYMVLIGELWGGFFLHYSVHSALLCFWQMEKILQGENCLSDPPPFSWV